MLKAGANGYSFKFGSDVGSSHSQSDGEEEVKSPTFFNENGTRTVATQPEDTNDSFETANKNRDKTRLIKQENQLESTSGDW